MKHTKLTAFLSAAAMAAALSAFALPSASAYAAENTEKFYYTADGTNVRVSMAGTLEFPEAGGRNIIIACYDKGALIKTKLIPVSEMLDGAQLRSFTLSLDKQPEELEIKALAWSIMGNIVPLCVASELTDVPKNAHKTEGFVTGTFNSGANVDKNEVRVEMTVNGNTENVCMNIGDTDIDDHLFEPAEIYYDVSDDYEYTIISYSLKDAGTVTLSKSDIDFDRSSGGTIYTTDGRQLTLASDCEFHVNNREVGSDVIADAAGAVEFIKNMPEKHGSIKLIKKGDSYGFLLIDRYSAAVLDSVLYSKTEAQAKVLFDEYDADITGGRMILDLGDDDKLYRFFNENGEECDYTQLYSARHKNIYIAYDLNDRFSDSDYYRVIIDGAQRTAAAEDEFRLNSVKSSLLLKYSDTENTAFLEGELIPDCSGIGEYPVYVRFIKDGEPLDERTINVSSLLSKLKFAGGDTDSIYKFELDGKPDSAVISFDEEHGVDDIIVPAVSAQAQTVYGRVTGTFRSGAYVAPGELYFTIEKADSWEGDKVNAAAGGDTLTIKAYDGTGSADKNPFIYSKATIEKTDAGYTLTSLVPVGPQTLTLQTGDYKRITSNYNGYDLLIYKDDLRVSYDTYKLSPDCMLYVNGREVDNSTISANNVNREESIIGLFNGEFVKGNKSGKITLVDASDEGRASADGIYDHVMISYHVDGTVEEVYDQSGKTTIYLDTYDARISNGKIVIDGNNESKDYSITLNGESIDVSELKPGDVLSVEYDVTGSFKDSPFYDIFVSRDTVEGTVSSVYEDPDDVFDNEYTFDNGRIYKLAYEDAGDLNSSSSYTLYLDAFGRIAKAEELASSKKYALLENVYMTNGDADAYVDIVTGTGEKVSYQIRNEDRDAFEEILGAEYDSYDKLANRAAPQDRVISYKVTTKGELRLDGTAVAVGTYFNGEYKSNTQKIDGKQLSESLSQIVDITDYDEYKSQSYDAVGMEDFREGITYQGYAYGRTGSDRIYQFVLVTEGMGGFNVIDNWAVFVQLASVYTDNGDSDAVTAYIGGELRTIPLETDALIRGMAAGDVFFYKLNNDGEIEEVRAVTSGGMLNSSYNDLLGRAINNGFDMLNSDISEGFAAIDEYSGRCFFAKSDRINSCELVFGPIVNKSSGNVSIVTPAALNRGGQSIDNFCLDNAKDYSIDENANICLYNYGISRAKDRVSVSDTAHIIKSTFDRSAYVGDRLDNVVNFKAEYEAEHELDNYNEGNLVFAVAKVINGGITEMLVIKPDNGPDYEDMTVIEEEPLPEYYSLGILEDVYLAEGGAEAYVEIAAAEGEKITRSIDPAAYETFKNILIGDNTDVSDETRLENRRSPHERVISYEENGDGSIILNQVEEGDYFDGEYKSGTKKLDTRQLANETQLIDITDYDTFLSQSYPMIGLEDLQDGINYSGYAFVRTGANKVYRFVIVTDGIGGFNVMNDWAVFVRSTTTATDNGEMPAAEMYVGGQLVAMPVEDESMINGMAAGDIFFYKLNRNREIEEIRMVTAESALNNSYQSFFRNALETKFDILDASTSAGFANEDGYSYPYFAKPNNVDDCELIAGPIVDTAGGDVYIATPNELYRSGQSIDVYSIDKTRPYELAEDVNVYVYDYSITREKDRISPASAGSIRKSKFDRNAYVGDKKDNIVDFMAELDIEYVSSNANFGNVNFAVAKVVDNVITEIMVIIPSEDED